MTDMQDIPLAKLEPHPRNVRRALHDLDDLAASIKAKGIVQALTVVPHPTARTKFMVLGGHRRLAAAKLAKLKAAPCMVREDLDTAEAQTEFMIVENTQRNDLAPMEEARAYQELLELPGYNAKRIAENTGRKHRLVTDRIKLSKISDPIADKLDGGQITLEQALIFAEFADDEAATKKLLGDVGSYNWDWRVRDLRQAKKASAQRAKSAKDLAAVGVEFASIPDQYPWGGEYTIAPTTEPLTTAEHVAAGHKPLANRGGGIEWAVLRSELPDAQPARELTPAEIAAAEEYDRVKAGLEVAGHVRRQFLDDIFDHPTMELAKKIILPKTAEYLIQRKGARSLIGLDEDAKPAEVTPALARFSLEQLVVAQALVPLIDSTALLEPDAWGEGRYGVDYTASARKMLADVLDYEWSDIEKEAMDRARRLHEERSAVEAERRAAQKQSEARAAADEDQDDGDD